MKYAPRICFLTLMLLASLAISGCDRNPATTPQERAATVPASTAAATNSATPTLAAATEATIPTAADTLAEEENTVETVATPNNQVEPAIALRTANTSSTTVAKSIWQEGTHYTRLTPTQPTSALPGQVEVMEFFWYGCPHCFALDPYLEQWRAAKPSYISFVRVPILWGQTHGLHARIYYTEQALGLVDKLHTSVFNEFHQNQHPLNSTADIEQFFTQHGASTADFKTAFRSEAVEASLKQAQELGLRFKVESVPLIIINGKYVTDVGKAGGQQQLISLINELAAREHGV